MRKPAHLRSRVLIGVVVAVLALAGVVALGPRVRFVDGWREPTLPDDLDAWLASSEARVPGVRDGDEKGIVWVDPEGRARTTLSLVYLHGFSADRHEIEPVVSEVGEALGANVYFTRLSGHGRDGAAMAGPTVGDWLDDTAEAMAIGERIGERVVLVGTSTGGTLAAWAASRTETASRLAAIVLISPNFQPRDRSSRILLLPWGGVIARLVVGSERCFAPENEAQQRHWTTCYPTSTLSTMMALVEHVRTMDLSGIAVPTLALYSPGDQVVDPAETERVLRGMTGTTPEVIAFRGSNDPEQHVLAGDIVSPASSEEVAFIIERFVERRVR